MILTTMDIKDNRTNNRVICSQDRDHRQPNISQSTTLSYSFPTVTLAIMTILFHPILMLLTPLVSIFSKKGNTVHKLIAANKNSKALGADRRDDLRYNLRAKLSTKDYVGKDMKQYHYKQQSTNL